MHMACGFVTAAVALAVTSGASAQTASEFKTLKIVVGFSTGGGYDTYARVLSRHMGRHLPGTPGIIVAQSSGWRSNAESSTATAVPGAAFRWNGSRPGRSIPSSAFRPSRSPGLPAHVPFAGELATPEARDVLGIPMTTDVLGRPFIASRQVPAARLAALRKAFDATMKDAQFLAEAEKLNLPVAGPISGLEAEKIIASF